MLMPEIISRYTSGEKIVDLSREYGTSHQTLGRYLRKFGTIVEPPWKRYPSPFKGRHHTKESKRQQRISRLGHEVLISTREKLSKATSGKNNPNFGNGDRIRGSKNPNWLGGIWLGQNQYRMFKKDRDKILERDLYQCLLCYESTTLNVHHIDYNRKNREDNNLITLCARCHGKTNYDREFWTKFFWGFEL